jgi:hypothetical protein
MQNQPSSNGARDLHAIDPRTYLFEYRAIMAKLNRGGGKRPLRNAESLRASAAELREGLILWHDIDPRGIESPRTQTQEGRAAWVAKHVPGPGFTDRLGITRTIEQQRRSGRAGGKATAANRRARQDAGPTVVPQPARTQPQTTAAEAIARLDAQFPWLCAAWPARRSFAPAQNL